MMPDIDHIFLFSEVKNLAKELFKEWQHREVPQRGNGLIHKRNMKQKVAENDSKKERKKDM